MHSTIAVDKYDQYDNLHKKHQKYFITYLDFIPTVNICHCHNVSIHNTPCLNLVHLCPKNQCSNITSNTTIVNNWLVHIHPHILHLTGSCIIITKYEYSEPKKNKMKFAIINFEVTLIAKVFYWLCFKLIFSTNL